MYILYKHSDVHGIFTILTFVCFTKQLSQKGKELTINFATEMLSFKRTLTEDIKKEAHKTDLLFIVNFSVACSIPPVCTVYLFSLTLPVNMASAE